MAAAARHARKRRNPQFSLGLENRNGRVFQKEQEKGSASTSPSPPRRLAWEQQRSSRRRFRQSPARGRPATSCPAGGASPGKPTLEGGGHRKGGQNHRQWESGDIAKRENKNSKFWEGISVRGGETPHLKQAKRRSTSSLGSEAAAIALHSIGVRFRRRWWDLSIACDRFCGLVSGNLFFRCLLSAGTVSFPLRYCRGTHCLTDSVDFVFLFWLWQARFFWVCFERNLTAAKKTKLISFATERKKIEHCNVSSNKNNFKWKGTVKHANVRQWVPLQFFYAIFSRVTARGENLKLFNKSTKN